MSDNKINDMVKKKIMRKVYAIWFFRQLARPVFIEAVLLSFLIFLASRYIYVFSVMRNAFNSSDSVYSLSGFFVRNFMIADTISQLIALGLFATLMFLGKDLFKFST
jgi:hypothetical protein